MANSNQDKNQYLISLNENNLTRVINWVSAVDSKANFVLTIVLVVAGIVISQIDHAIELSVRLWYSREYSLVIIMGGLLLGAMYYLTKSLVYLLIVIYPKRIPYTQKDSAFFYDSISGMASTDFTSEMESIKLQDAIRGLADQTYNLSKVVSAKFDQLSVSIKSFSVGLSFFVIYMLLEIIISKIFS